MTVWEMLKYLSSGVGITFRLVPLCILATLALGAVLGTVQFRRVPVLSQLIDVYIVAMRGVPPLVVMMLLFYSVNLTSSFVTAFAALTIYHTAYVTEIVRGGFAAVPRGQMMAGESLGLRYGQIIGRIYIPQILLQIVPSLCGQYILTVKDTTLVSIVGVQDIMWRARQLIAVTFDPILIYFLAGLIFYVLCTVLEVVARRVERRVVRDVRTRIRGV